MGMRRSDRLVVGWKVGGHCSRRQRPKPQVVPLRVGARGVSRSRWKRKGTPCGDSGLKRTADLMQELRDESKWRALILFGRNVATYKFAFAQTLLEQVEMGKDRVSLDDLALPYAGHLIRHLAMEDKQITSASSGFLDACRAHAPGKRRMRSCRLRWWDSTTSSTPSKIFLARWANPVLRKGPPMAGRNWC